MAAQDAEEKQKPLGIMKHPLKFVDALQGYVDSGDPETCLDCVPSDTWESEKFKSQQEWLRKQITWPWVTAASMLKKFVIPAKVQDKSSAGDEKLLLNLNAYHKQICIPFGMQVTAGTSALLNIRLLIDKEVIKYSRVVVKDTLNSGFSLALAKGMDKIWVLNKFSPGAGLLVPCLYDAVEAAQSRDLQGFFYKTATNGCSQGATTVGARFGAEVGKVVWPGLGTMVGALIGGIGAAIAAKRVIEWSSTKKEKVEHLNSGSPKASPAFQVGLPGQTVSLAWKV